MMAKMFYTMDEAKAALGKSEDEIRAFSRDGRLREFRDGPRLMFKADQVEQLRADLGGGGGGMVSDDMGSSGSGLDQVDLGVSDSGGLIGLVDTTGASGTSITLSDADASSGSGIGMKMKDDTALAADLGLSGSLGGMPSPARPPGGTGAPLSGTGLSGSMRSGSGAGINVFGTDETIEHADPSRQTAISGNIRDQIDLQGVGSGSGLLDLTRESDDTSLGAVLDEITPAGGRAGRSGTLSGSMSGSLAGGSLAGGSGAAMDAPVFEDAPAPRAVAAPVYVNRPDPWAPAFGGMALGAAVVTLLGIFALISAVGGTRPDLVTWFADKGLPVAAGMGMGLVIVFFVFGLILGRLGRS